MSRASRTSTECIATAGKPTVTMSNTPIVVIKTLRDNVAIKRFFIGELLLFSHIDFERLVERLDQICRVDTATDCRRKPVIREQIVKLP